MQLTLRLEIIGLVHLEVVHMLHMILSQHY